MAINSLEPSGVEINPDAEAEADAEFGNGGEAEAAPVAVKETPPEKVTLSQPTSRRARAAAERASIEATVNELKTTFSKTQEDFRRELAARDAEIARLRGYQEALATSRTEANRPQGPTPDDLYRKAQEALDSGNHSEYRRLEREALKLELKSEMERSQPARQETPAQNPVIGALLAQHPAVMMAGQRGIQLAIAQDQVLAAMGVPDGPERYAKAFANAQSLLGGQAAQETPAAFSRTAAATGALSGVPTSRPANGGGAKDPGVRLTAQEVRWAEAAGMTKEEMAKYIAESHPERVES